MYYIKNCDNDCRKCTYGVAVVAHGVACVLQKNHHQFAHKQSNNNNTNASSTKTHTTLYIRSIRPISGRLVRIRPTINQQRKNTKIKNATKGDHHHFLRISRRWRHRIVRNIRSRPTSHNKNIIKHHYLSNNNNNDNNNNNTIFTYR
jgi:hypothetical protein